MYIHCDITISEIMAMPHFVRDWENLMETERERHRPLSR